MMGTTIEPKKTGVTGGGNKLPPRREYTLEMKQRIVEETFVPEASVSIVARRHNVNSNLVFTWRKRHRAFGTHGQALLWRAALDAVFNGE